MVMESQLQMRLTLSLSVFLLNVLGSTAAKAQEVAPKEFLEQQSIALDRPLVLSIDSGLQEIPSSQSITNLLENYLLPAQLFTEESGGFGDHDPTKYSLYGASWAWNRAYIGGFDLSDPQIDGAEALQLPFRALGRVTLNYEELPENLRAGGLNLELSSRKTMGIQGQISGVGDIWPLAEFFMEAFSGIHGRARTPPPPEERRRFLQDLKFHATDSIEVPGARWTYGFGSQLSRRRFLRFDPQTGANTGVADEPAQWVSLFAERQEKDSLDSWLFLAGYQSRKYLFSELYHSPEESPATQAINLFAGKRVKNGHLGLHYHARELRTKSFSRELYDLDGESFFPFYAGGWQHTLKADFRWQGEWLFADLISQGTIFSAAQQQWSHPLTFEGSSVGSWRFSSEDSFRSRSEAKIGIRNYLEGESYRFDYQAYLSGNIALNDELENTWNYFDIGFKTRLNLRFSEDITGFIHLSKLPVAPTHQLGALLDPGYLEASRVGNSGQLIDTRGGSRLSFADGVRQTNIYSGAVGLNFQLNPNWKFYSQGLFKAFVDPYRIRLQGGPGEYGGYDDGFYYFGPGEKLYKLENETEQIPVYFSLHLQIMYADPDTLFSTGFSAYNGVGRAPFGNGPLENDPGMVDYSTANPNTWVNQLANYNLDRAFSLKTILGYRLWDQLWGYLGIQFRDGQPFAFYDARRQGDQVGLQHKTPRGSPFSYDRPLLGPREDFQFNVDAKLAYRFRFENYPLSAYLLAANLFDFGNEVSEPSSGEYGRASYEAQIPRSIILGLELIR